MKHGTFIHLDELDQAAWLGTEPEPEGRVALRAPVWTRPRLAAQLGVSEAARRSQWGGSPATVGALVLMGGYSRCFRWLDDPRGP